MIDKFISWFSYTSKLKLIFFLGYLPCIFIVIYALILFETPRKSLSKQMEGLEFYRELTSIVQSILYHIHWTNSQEFSENQLEARIDLLFVKQAHFENDSPSLLSDDLLEMSTELNRLNEAWKGIRDGKGPLPENVEILFNSYFNLLQSLTKVSELVLNLDYGTRYYSYSLLHNLPLILDNTLQLQMALRGKEKESAAPLPLLISILDNKNTLEKNIHQLLDHLKEAYRQNEIFQKQPYQEETLEKLHDWQEDGTRLIDEIMLFLTHPYVSNAPPQIEESAKQFLATSFSLSEKMHQQLKFALQSQKDTLGAYLFWTLGFIVLGSLLVSLLYFPRMIRRPVQNLKVAADEFSKGNFSVRVPVNGNHEVAEITSAFNSMMDYFEKILADAREVTKHLTDSASTIIACAGQLGTNVNVQEKTIKEIAFNAKGIKRFVQQFAEDIQKATLGANLTSKMASRGRSDLLIMEEIMRQMIQDSSNIVQTLSSLQEKVANINKVIETIVKIADQSNLLSLNTVILASKSGGQGRGFVVIAEKIREMANQIAYVTLDIEKGIKDIVAAVSTTVDRVAGFSDIIRKQVTEMANINEDLNRLINNAQRQIDYFEEINQGMQTQNRGLLDINRSINQLREASQDTAKAVRKLYAEIEYLHDSSQSLHEFTESFIFRGGSKGS